MSKLLIGALGLLMVLVQISAGHAASESGAVSAKKAMNYCSRQYCGHRGLIGNQQRPVWIEGCFKERTGKYPAELGVAIKIRHRCPVPRPYSTV
jgi:hypothetical protein